MGVHTLRPQWIGRNSTWCWETEECMLITLSKHKGRWRVSIGEQGFTYYDEKREALFVVGCHLASINHAGRRAKRSKGKSQDIRLRGK